jgi:Cullin family
MIVLMLLNEIPSDQGLTFEEIKPETSVPSNDLVNILYSLSTIPKWRVLKKDPGGKEIVLSDKVFLQRVIFKSVRENQGWYCRRV